MNFKSWRTLWIDQRKFSMYLVGGSFLIGIMAWALVSVAIAQSVPERHDAPVQVSDLIRFQWWALAGLLGLVQILVGFIVVRDMNNTKANIRDLYEKKLDKVGHTEIDHSKLCPVCRDAHLAIRMQGD